MKIQPSVNPVQLNNTCQTKCFHPFLNTLITPASLICLILFHRLACRLERLIELRMIVLCLTPFSKKSTHKSPIDSLVLLGTLLRAIRKPQISKHSTRESLTELVEIRLERTLIELKQLLMLHKLDMGFQHNLQSLSRSLQAPRQELSK